MTTIVAVRKAGQVAISADTLTTYGDCREPQNLIEDGSCKLIKVGVVTMATTGPASMSYVIADYFQKHPISGDMYRDTKAVYELFQNVRRYLEEYAGLNSVEDAADPFKSLQTEILMATPVGIYGIYPLGSVNKYSKYYAFGSGAEYALGALHAIYDCLDRASDISTLAVEAAATFDTHTQLPLDTHTFDLV